MSTMKHSLRFAAVLFALGVFTGCESTDGGGSVSGGVYYGTGFYDPWYYGGHYDHDDIVVTPPANRPDWGAHPEQPIARPPDVSSRPPTASPRPAARPMPSIPSTPRAAPRGGGGGRR